MSDDVFSAFAKGASGFAHSRAGALVGDSFSDTGSLISSLFDGTTGTTKAAFATLKADIEALVPLVEALVTALKADIASGKAAVQEMGVELGKDPFGAGEVMRCLTALGNLLVAYDSAISKCAEKLAEQEPAGPGRLARMEAIKAEINGTNAPIKKFFGNLGSAATGDFDKLCKMVLNIDNASDSLGDRMKWDYAEKMLSVKLVQAGAASLPPLNFDGGHIDAFFQYKSDPKIGLKLTTNMKAGLRSDKLLEKIMPKQSPTADTSSVAITLDTKDGLTFGSGADKRLVLPVRFAFPGVELREFAIEQPALDNVENKNRINVVFTIAGKLGDALAVVVEGGGVSIRWVEGGDPQITPKIPSGAGIRIKTAVVTGGGYLRYDEVKREYGGVFQLEIAKIGVTAIGLLSPDPFNMVIVMGVRFAPKIELGYGFTLNGLGGILAINRMLDSLALANGLKNDVVGQLLFPADPVAAAPEILNQLGAVFPPRDGGFVVGPIAEIGWGSQAGFLKARLGIVFCLPDPKIVLLGAVQIGVPSADIDKKYRVVDINANIMGEITLDYFFIKVSLAKSKVFTLELTGDIAIFVQWGGEGAFALSVGGFFPGYEYPKQLGTMDRCGIIFAPPVDWLSISVLAYFAVTSNSVQFGGKVDLKAKIGPVQAIAWLQIDALFQWAPHFYFVIKLDVGIKVTAFGVTLAGVQFTGELSGDKPWHLEGNAKAEILFWDVEVPIGPMEWGESTPAPLPEVDLIDTARQALQALEAWSPVLPAGANQFVRLAAGVTDDLFHPLGQLVIKQLQVPLETDIDRVGSSPVSTRRINLRAPKLGTLPAGAVWPVQERFSPGHFLNLTDDQVIARPEFELLQAGLGIAASPAATFSTAVHTGYGWRTDFPDETFGRTEPMRWALAKSSAKILASNAASKAMQARANPYDLAEDRPDPAVLHDRGAISVIARDTMAKASGIAAVLSPSAADTFIRDQGGDAVRFTTLAAGLAI